ncbi:MAG: hypothetical protein MKZ94_09570 [Pirellulales bacterium]|nr:hypothetical protein [Pirellulales bacterium]
MKKKSLLLLFLLTGCTTQENSGSPESKSSQSGTVQEISDDEAVSKGGTQASLTLQSITGVYTRKDNDGTMFKLAIDQRGHFVELFQNLFEDISGNTFAQQAAGICEIVGEEIHMTFSTPESYAKEGVVLIHHLNENENLVPIGIVSSTNSRHDFSEDEKREMLDWVKSNSAENVRDLFVEGSDADQSSGANSSPDEMVEVTLGDTPLGEIKTSVEPATEPANQESEEGSKQGWVSEPNPQNVLVERAIRSSIFKETGELSRDDLNDIVSLTFLSQLNDTGLKYVGNLSSVKSLLLVKTDITDAGLQQIAKIDGLMGLTIVGSNITDIGLEEIAKLSKLEELSLLALPQLTDDGLKKLSKMTNLRSLKLQGTQISSEGVEKLKQQLPELEVK